MFYCLIIFYVLLLNYANHFRFLCMEVNSNFLGIESYLICFTFISHFHYRDFEFYSFLKALVLCFLIIDREFPFSPMYFYHGKDYLNVLWGYFAIFCSPCPWEELFVSDSKSSVTEVSRIYLKYKQCINLRIRPLGIFWKKCFLTYKFK